MTLLHRLPDALAELLSTHRVPAHLIDAAGGCVLAPDRTSIPGAADWVTEVLGDNDMWDKLGRRARELAEREFELTQCATRFEEILVRVSR